jgi:hypothetical protein
VVLDELMLLLGEEASAFGWRWLLLLLLVAVVLTC